MPWTPSWNGESFSGRLWLYGALCGAILFPPAGTIPFLQDVRSGTRSGGSIKTVRIPEMEFVLFLLYRGEKEPKRGTLWKSREFRPLRRSTKGSALGTRKPLKRLERNFYTGSVGTVCEPVTLLSVKSVQTLFYNSLKRFLEGFGKPFSLKKVSREKPNPPRRTTWKVFLIFCISRWDI